MIKEQFLYFAQYPAKDGVLAMFTNGSGDMPGYNTLVKALKALPESSRIPEIANYVYGQSFDELKQRIDKLVGSFLFVDYGEMDMLASRAPSASPSVWLSLLLLKCPTVQMQPSTCWLPMPHFDSFLKSTHGSSPMPMLGTLIGSRAANLIRLKSFLSWPQSSPPLVGRSCSPALHPTHSIPTHSPGPLHIASDSLPLPA